MVDEIVWLYPCNQHFWDGDDAKLCNPQEIKRNLHLQLFGEPMFNTIDWLFYIIIALPLSIMGGLFFIAVILIWFWILTNFDQVSPGAFAVLIFFTPFGIGGAALMIKVPWTMFLALKHRITVNKVYRDLITNGKKMSGRVLDIRGTLSGIDIRYLLAPELTGDDQKRAEYLTLSKSPLSIRDTVAILYLERDKLISVIL